MPAITLGLAEVEERLRALRRRLNSVTAQHSIYLGASSATLLVAAVIVVGLRASAPTFRIVACGSALLAMIVAAASLGYARRRWLDLQHTAHLADTRAQLTDRLSTVVDLRLRPRPSRLAPVLVAQALALGSQWQARQIAPRRIPRSIFLLVASLLTLAATAFVERRTPPQVPSPTTATAEQLAALGSETASGAHHSSDMRTQPPGSARDLQPPTTLLPPGDFPGRATNAETGRQQSWSLSPSSERAKSRPSLTDRLQQTIQHAFRGDAPEQRAQLASGSGISSHHDIKSDPDRNSKANRGGRADDTAPKQAASSGQRKESESGTHGTQPQTGSNAPQNFQGSSPRAGEGSSPHGLMDPNAPAAVAGHGDANRFKLAITSFLRPMPEPAGRPSGGGRAGAAESGGSGVALNERQMVDDAVRKAEIPPEYEDLVRRVYSRAEP
jgi:hypothetical protein